MYSPLRNKQIKDIAKQAGICDCFLQGNNKQQLLGRICGYYRRKIEYNMIDGSEESLKEIIELKKQLSDIKEKLHILKIKIC